MRAAWIVLTAFALLGCNEIVDVDRFRVGADAAADAGADASAVRDSGPTNDVDTGCEAEAESCNDEDDDCDGMVDEARGTIVLCDLDGATGACVSGRCTITSCDEPLLDCDGLAENGCEVDPASSDEHCGGCGSACAAGLACTESECGRISSVSLGAYHSCVVRTGGSVWCWGQNDRGQLGNGTRAASLAPTRVVGVEGARDVACGFASTCALLETGEVRCWGDNGAGQLGDGMGGPDASSTEPVTVDGLTDAVELVLGESHACARRRIGGVVCWGDGSRGQLGHGSFGVSLVPVAALDLGDALGLFGGPAARHSCARAFGARDMRCWGENENGQLGDGSTERRNVPVDLADVDMLTTAAVGEAHTCVVQGRRAFCVGSNRRGQLGDGLTTDASRVVRVDLPDDVSGVAAGFASSCALRVSGAVHCWGDDSVGTLGRGAASTEPRPIPAAVVDLENVVEISMGFGHACAMTSASELWCWGFNASGQVGDGSVVDRPTPTRVTLP